jgi:hypothetical protein
MTTFAKTRPALMEDLPPPVPHRISEDLRSDFGLVSPEGKFYACDSWEHGYTGRCLNAYGSNGNLLPGWIHVAGDRWDMDEQRELTQGQIDIIFAWCQAASWRNYDMVMAGLVRR